MEIQFEVKTLEIAGFASALQALRLPFGKEARSNVSEFFDMGRHSDCDDISLAQQIDVSHEDIKLMQTLCRRGDEHAKALRGIMVYAEINAPRYLWQEIVTYEVGAIKLSSESTMHIQGKGLSTEELVEMKNKLPEGTMQKRVYAFSYQTLRRIYHQRKDHRLPHWHKFCDWMRTLPYFEEFIEN